MIKSRTSEQIRKHAWTSSTHPADLFLSTATTKPAATTATTVSTASTKNGRWTAEEHRLFLQGYKQHGTNWKRIATMIKSRTSKQIRKHAQSEEKKKQREEKKKRTSEEEKKKQAEEEKKKQDKNERAACDLINSLTEAQHKATDEATQYWDKENCRPLNKKFALAVDRCREIGLKSTQIGLLIRKKAHPNTYIHRLANKDESLRAIVNAVRSKKILRRVLPHDRIKNGGTSAKPTQDQAVRM
ncbi:hypothetical protein ACHAXR_000454, partial [Thalassiosira sp. AJA248-18]